MGCTEQNLSSDRKVWSKTYLLHTLAFKVDDDVALAIILYVVQLFQCHSCMYTTHCTFQQGLRQTEWFLLENFPTNTFTYYLKPPHMISLTQLL